jgi:hypothetical protein
VCITKKITSQDGITWRKIMRIIRTDLKAEKRTVITNNATMQDWYKLLEKASKKVAIYESGMPAMTQWNRRFQIITKTGNHFKFELSA